MPAPLTIRSEFLKPLASLAFVPQGGGAYYRELRRSDDPYLTVGSWCQLLDGNLVPPLQWEEVLPFCRFGAVRRRAFATFRTGYRPDLARRAAETPLDTTADAEQASMLATLDEDGAGAEAEGQLYLASGDLQHLRSASEQAEIAGGWRAALLWAVRSVAIAPLNPVPIQRLFVVLESSAQPELLEEVAEVLNGRNLHLQTSQLFLAGAAIMRKDSERALKLLKPLDDAKVAANAALKPYLGAIRAMRAQSEEELGHYQRAYDAYVALNTAERAQNIDPEHYYRGIAARGRLNIPALPAYDGQPVVQMLSFPRSGTTLLENVLAAHPSIETFEETSAMNMAIDRIEGPLMGRRTAEPAEQTFLAARDTYYADIERRRRKPGAHVLIDKLPIRSAEADFVIRLFPEFRYIFSIRHPYDVVLSCFKQRFVPNPAMENFRSIAAGARLYDFAMTEWFKRHTMDDPGVIYVRYDELVTDFERVTSGVLDFLGVEWNDAVRDFAAAASKRAAKTPSYQKVRQGLSIGVQSQWRNYGFLFQSKETEPLRKWAAFFGYETE